jgi:hypothetical protein
MFQDADDPFLGNFREKRPDIGVEDEVHLLAADPDDQRIVLAALGRSAVNLSFFLCLAACRMRSSACDTLARSCARRVLCWLAFPLVSVLGSTGSAADRSALFVGFPATTTA